ncbi:uncharacterized protein LOC124167364 isoform X2 [Ischnura elegans]|uniref:uncharacterized protein LOC124167364 isoform X2 n=1 Tax=Ischnura elegans TaxID=197161 RepID=UPI001ED87EE9|nr:uncharacterized protein LOC124167364 isoform X2 [Ischnura elegans]
MEAGDAASASACYTSGSVAGAVFGTLLTVLVLAGLAYLFWRFYWRRRRGKHLTLETSEKGEIPASDGPLGDRFAFDNPCFLTEDASPNRKNKKGAPKIKADGTQGKADKNVKSDKSGGTGRLGKWTSWSPLGALVGGGGTNGKGNDKRRAFDDSCVGEPERVSVSLRGHDFTGLGFNVCGNMRDGIFVRDVLHRGPASESGQIAAGDRIVSLGISFEHMVFEDALTILSYASPYEVLLQVEKGASPPGSTLLAGTDISSGQTSLKRNAASTTPSAGASNSPDKQRAIICHPFYRSQSIDDLDKIGKASINAKRAQQIAEMTRLKSNTQDEANHGSTRGGIAEVDGRPHHKDVEDEKLQKREAPSEEDLKKDGEMGSHHHGYQKFGVRVLPMGNPGAGTHAQGVGKVHNPGHQSNPPVGSRTDRAEEVSITIATPEPQKQNERNSMIEMGVGKDMKVVVAPHNPGDNNPSSKSAHDADVKNAVEESAKPAETKITMPPNEDVDGIKKHENPTNNPHNDKTEVKVEMREKKKETHDKISSEGMMIDVPEEVCMAGMAAVTNRKMGGSSQQAKVEEEEVLKQNGRVRYNSGGSGDEGSEDGDRILGNTPGSGGKRRAPAPPAETPENNPGDGDAAEPTSSEATMEEETPLCIPVTEERKKKGGTRIELGLDHITIHHQPQPTEKIPPMNTEEDTAPMETTALNEEKDNGEGNNSMTAAEENSSDTEADDAPTAKRAVTTVTGGKAASLGDLSCLEGGEVHRPPRMRAGPSSVTGPGEGVVLERAVSLDLGNAEEVVTCPTPTASIGSAKKRKAPAPPAPVSRGNSNGSDEIDGSSRADTGLDGDEYGKEPRLIGIGTTDTFGRRLKKSSDWGTMEEALLAGGSPSSSSTSSSTSAGRTILHLGSVPSFIPLSTSDGVSDEVFGPVTTEVSTTRTVEAPQGGSELIMASMLKKIHSQPEISLQSSVITSSDIDTDANATVTSTSEMPKASDAQMNSPSSAEENRVIVTTSASIEEAVDSTTYPSQQNSRGARGIVHLEAADTANSHVGGEGDKVEPSSESFPSSFQRAREFFEREDDKSAGTPMEEDNSNNNDDDDDEVTSLPPSLPTSPIPTLQPSSPLSLHSTTTYISSIEDIPVVPGLLDSREFGVTTHSTPGSQHHITEIQVTSMDDDGKKVETREVVVSQDGDETFGRVRDIISSAIERNSLGSNEEKISVNPMKLPNADGEIQSSMYINDSFPTTDGTKANHRIGYKLTANMSEPNYQVGKSSSSLTDNGTIEMSTQLGPIVGSSNQVIEEIGSTMDTITSSEISCDSNSPIVQIRMREGPSGWIPYRNSGEEKADGKKEIMEGSGEPPKVPKKKPPVPPRKDASSSPSSESQNRSETNIISPFSSSVKTVVEVPMSFTKRLVQVHEMRSDDGTEEMEGRQDQPMHRISEREVIQITPQELDKVMMSHSQFLSHKRGEPSPSKSEQWIPGATRSVVHRIVEKWVTDEDGTRKIITETSVREGGETVTEVIESEGGNATPPNGVVSTVPEGNALDGASESHKQNMSVTRILVDPEFASNLGRSSDGVMKTVKVANLQLSGLEGKPSVAPSGLQT